MARITDLTTYPATVPALGDHVPGVDRSDTGNSVDGEVVSFTLQAVMDLFEANIVLDTARVQTGTFADARISQSSVTQHQAALSITESQISDLQAYLLNITGEPLSDLSDVTITSIAAGEVLKWSGTAWVNNTLAEAGIAAASHTHVLSEVTDAGTIASQDASNVSITGGSISGITDLAVADGGTGGSTASAARTNLGVEIGSDVQAWDADLDTYAANPLTAAELGELQNIGTTTISAAQWGYLGAATSFGGSLLDDADASAGRTTLGLGTVSTQDANSVNLDGGTIDGVTIGGATPAAGSFTTLDASGDLTVDTDTLYVDSTNGNVGIGETSPQAKLHVDDGGATIPSLSSGTIGHFSNTGNVNVSLQAGAANNASVLFGDSGNQDAGYVAYLNASDALLFGANSSERMRIDSSGNVGIGTTSPDVNGSAYGDLVLGGNASGSSISFYEDSGATALGKIIGITTGEFRVSADATGGFVTFRTNGGGIGTEAMRIDSSGNVGIGGTSAGANSAGNLTLFNGTAPTGSVTDGVILYAEDVSTSSELKVRDEAGNVTTLSPHNFDLIPEGPSEDMAWSYYSERDGKRINVDMLKAIRLLESISGEKLVYEA